MDVAALQGDLTRLKASALLRAPEGQRFMVTLFWPKNRIDLGSKYPDNSTTDLFENREIAEDFAQRMMERGFGGAYQIFPTSFKIDEIPIGTLATMQDLEQEVARLCRGEFTEEEFQNLCHKFGPEDAQRFCQGCEHYQQKLFGSSPITKLRDDARQSLELIEGLRESLVMAESEKDRLAARVIELEAQLHAQSNPRVPDLGLAEVRTGQSGAA